MGCCCSCLNSCCCTEAGLRCHTVVSICGFFYFLLMFLLFERQKNFFEFSMPNQDGTKWALLAVAAIWLFLFFICLGQLNKLVQNKPVEDGKKRMTLYDIKATRQPQPFENKSEQTPFLKEQR